MNEEDVKAPPEVVATPRRRGPNKKKAKPKQTGYAKVVSTAGMNPSDLEKLQSQIADLQGQLASEREARTIAEEAALLQAESQGMMQQREIREIPTGRTRTVQRANGYKVVGHKDSGVPILAPKWQDVELPTFFYKIDLPPVGGLQMRVNGVDLFHGSTQELDIDQLRSVKDMVHRCWAHDASIHGTDENAYRPKKGGMVSARGFA